jgi:rhodanese-related sulfurtransferase
MRFVSSWRTRQGVREIDPTWVQAHRDEVRLVDVREPDELVETRIEGVENVPLCDVERVAAAWDRGQPIVLVCRSGGRSGRAALALERMGFESVVSMAGGMLAWNEQKLPAVRG